MPQMQTHDRIVVTGHGKAYREQYQAVSDTAAELLAKQADLMATKAEHARLKGKLAGPVPRGLPELLSREQDRADFAAAEKRLKCHMLGVDPDGPDAEAIS